MPTGSQPIESLPSRPVTIEETDELEATDRFDVVFGDDKMSELHDHRDVVLQYNLVFVAETRVSAVVFIEEAGTWSRVYNEPRSQAVLTDAYEAIREVRGHDDLFDEHELTVEAVVFAMDRPGGTDSSGYEPGETFSCPVCDSDHEVKFHDGEYAAALESVDTSYLYLECPKTKGNELAIEYQASTPRR
jgi:hypothetical protein